MNHASCLRLLLIGIAVGGCETTRAARNIESEASQVMQAMGLRLSDTDQFSFRADISSDEAVHGHLVHFVSHRQVTVRRPDGLAADAEGDRVQRQIWYDGERLTVLDRRANVYASEAAPPTIDAMLDEAMSRFGVHVPLADLLFARPDRGLMRHVTEARHAGRVLVDGTLCHYLVMRQENIDWQIWIDQDLNVPRRFVITYKHEPGSPQFEARLHDWNLDAPAVDMAFRAEIPEGTARVEMSRLMKTLSSR